MAASNFEFESTPCLIADLAYPNRNLCDYCLEYSKIVRKEYILNGDQWNYAFLNC